MGEFGVVFQNEPVDVSEEFSKQENHFFVGDRVEEFDPKSASGRLCWKGFSLKQRVSYHQITTQFEDYRTWEDLPPGEYEDDRGLPLDLSFVTPRTVRLRLAARPEGYRTGPTLMLEDERWYREKLAGLLETGIGIFTADFGEAAPLSGTYASRKGGFHEHNLYPLRYNRAVAGATEEVTGHSASFSRSAWAGSQRYPLHWGGDAENSDGGMAGTLRGGLSLGLCGFSFWSHFIGGFPYATPEDLYRRWLAFGVLTSHSRCHGRPPTEPWEYDEEFTGDFRRTVELRYRLMPYIYAQAAHACREGHPMLRTLFFEYPEDRTSWLVEDEYLFGTDILVAPLMEEARSRDVYLPPGLWSDYQGGETYEGTRWHHVRAGEVPVVMLAREGTAIPHARLAQSTERIEWGEIELRVFGTGDSAQGRFCHPEEGGLQVLRLARGADGFALEEDPLGGRVNWKVRTVP